MRDWDNPRMTLFFGVVIAVAGLFNVVKFANHQDSFSAFWSAISVFAAGGIIYGALVRMREKK